MGFKSNILLVDNEPSIAEILLKLFVSRGYHTEIVQSGQQALLKAKIQTDLIILDTALPDYDGLEICHILKQDILTNHIPIIVLGDHNNEDRLRSFHLEAEDFLLKPFEPELLFAKAELSLRRQAFPSEITADHEFDYDVIKQLRFIIENEAVVPFFQPIYSLNPIQLLGVEVLARPQVKGRLSNPEILFREAIRYGMYYELEMMVWRKAIASAYKVLDKEFLFLNCDPHLIEHNHNDDVKELFASIGMDPGHVFFEITERSAISEFGIFFKRLSQYREQGFKIAIDDVGAGFASLEAIIQTKPEVVKIDRQIIMGALENNFKQSIVKLIVAFCNENDIICVAEGIEFKEDLEFLIDIGVQAGQGYYLHRPTEEINLKAMRSIAA